MNFGQAIILGILQGLTEFLPISSSGHLVITERLFGLKLANIVFDVAVHVGTLVAVLVYYRKKLLTILRAMLSSTGFGSMASVPAGVSEKADARKLFWYLVAGSLPAAVIGLSFKGFFESTFTEPRLVSAFLMVTGLVLFSTRFARAGSQRLNLWRALAVGCAQAVAILPGISRSGSTIAAALLLGVAGPDAAEFSFLLSVPAVAGAAFLELRHLNGVGADSQLLFLCVAGALAAFAVGLGAIHFLVSYLKRGNLVPFGYYCLAVGGFFVYYFR